jgi:hypothetical protein
MEAAEVMALPEGTLIVFSRGLRRIAQDSRSYVLKSLPPMPWPPALRDSEIPCLDESGPIPSGRPGDKW